MKLDNTTRKLQVLLDATVSTTACDVIVCYRDENRNAPQAIGAVPSATYLSTVSSATVVDMLPAPLVNTVVRVPERISLKNRDTTTRTPTFRFNDNATTYQFWSPQLLTRESAFYDENQGWYSTDANGAIKTALGTAGQFSSLTVSGNTTLGDAAADSLTVNAGVFSAPNIPAFLAVNSADDTDVTGNGTTYTVICNTEIYDQGANYNNGTGVFTAPTAGRYHFELCAFVDQISASTEFRVTLVTSNRSYTTNRAGLASTAWSQTSIFMSTYADMDANDTASMTAYVNGLGADTADVLGGGNQLTRFSGKQVA